MNQPWLDEIVRRGSGEALVALTYDDGPGRYTPDLLDLLAGHGAKATFFLVGSQIEQYADVARRIVADGHEVGSHTMAHHNHKEVEPRVAVSDMLEGAAAIERVLGFVPGLYRAPYGRFISETVEEAGSRGWRCVGWSAVGVDWPDHQTGRRVAERVLPKFKPGVIVLLHDSNPFKPINPEAMLGSTEILLAEAERVGLQAVTIGRLLADATSRAARPLSA